MWDPNCQVQFRSDISSYLDQAFPTIFWEVLVWEVSVLAEIGYDDANSFAT